MLACQNSIPFVTLIAIIFVYIEKIRESGFYKDSLEMVNHYPPAVEHLGKPIKGHRITYADPENKLTDTDICVSFD